MSLSVAEVSALLGDASASITDQMNALFTLKQLGTPDAVKAIESAFTSSSVLLRHEAAYVLGQTESKAAIPILTKLLSDQNEHSIVRHEAGEALGAIGDPKSLEVLRQFLNDPLLEVAETCELAIGRIEWLENNKKNNELYVNESVYKSVDPTPPFPLDQYTVPELGTLLMSPSEGIYQRYRALFTLREIGSGAAVEEMNKAIVEAEGALLKHEIAYVMGQVQRIEAVSGLVTVLKRDNEHEMVRHEAAEALGSIIGAVEDPSSVDSEVHALLQAFSEAEGHGEDFDIVKESCEVALDISSYWQKADL